MPKCIFINDIKDKLNFVLNKTDKGHEIQISSSEGTLFFSALIDNPQDLMDFGESIVEQGKIMGLLPTNQLSVAPIPSVKSTLAEQKEKILEWANNNGVQINWEELALYRGKGVVAPGWDDNDLPTQIFDYIVKTTEGSVDEDKIFYDITETREDNLNMLVDELYQGLVGLGYIGGLRPQENTIVELPTTQEWLNNNVQGWANPGITSWFTDNDNPYRQIPHFVFEKIVAITSIQNRWLADGGRQICFPIYEESIFWLKKAIVELGLAKDNPIVSNESAGLPTVDEWITNNIRDSEGFVTWFRHNPADESRLREVPDNVFDFLVLNANSTLEPGNRQVIFSSYNESMEALKDAIRALGLAR